MRTEKLIHHARTFDMGHSTNQKAIVVGEIANILTGQLKSCLCDAGVPWNQD